LAAYYGLVDGCGCLPVALLRCVVACCLVGMAVVACCVDVWALTSFNRTRRAKTVKDTLW
jgi:hypothetical protein